MPVAVEILSHRPISVLLPDLTHKLQQLKGFSHETFSEHTYVLLSKPDGRSFAQLCFLILWVQWPSSSPLFHQFSFCVPYFAMPYKTLTSFLSLPHILSFFYQFLVVFPTLLTADLISSDTVQFVFSEFSSSFVPSRPNSLCPCCLCLHAHMDGISDRVQQSSEIKSPYKVQIFP